MELHAMNYARSKAVRVVSVKAKFAPARTVPTSSFPISNSPQPKWISRLVTFLSAPKDALLKTARVANVKATSAAATTAPTQLPPTPPNFPQTNQTSPQTTTAKSLIPSRPTKTMTIAPS